MSAVWKCSHYLPPVRCRWYRWCTLIFKYLREFSKKFEMTLMLLSEACGNMIHEKNQKQKISDTVSLRLLHRFLFNIVYICCFADLWRKRLSGPPLTQGGMHIVYTICFILDIARACFFCWQCDMNVCIIELNTFPPQRIFAAQD